MPPKPWKIISSRQDKSYRIFSLRIDRAVSPRTGQAHNFFILETPPWINVIPLTAQNEVILVRQYRHGIRRVTLELPGGLVEDHETPEAAAKRELLEETGFKASEMVLLGAMHPNSAILNNQCFTFLAKDVFYAKTPQLDEKEDIQVIIKPLAEIPQLIRRGDITHALVLAAFYRFYMEYGNVKEEIKPP